MNDEMRLRFLLGDAMLVLAKLQDELSRVRQELDECRGQLTTLQNTLEKPQLTG